MWRAFYQWQQSQIEGNSILNNKTYLTHPLCQVEYQLRLPLLLPPKIMSLPPLADIPIRHQSSPVLLTTKIHVSLQDWRQQAVMNVEHWGSYSQWHDPRCVLCCVGVLLNSTMNELVQNGMLKGDISGTGESEISPKREWNIAQGILKKAVGRKWNSNEIAPQE